jgi:hypothetical protein
VFLTFILLVHFCVSTECDCCRKEGEENPNFDSNNSYLHSYAVMNMDHLYYGIPFYGSSDDMYFQYSDDYPCKCNREEAAINCKENEEKKSNKMKKNLRKAEEKVKNPVTISNLNENGLPPKSDEKLVKKDVKVEKSKEIKGNEIKKLEKIYKVEKTSENKPKTNLIEENLKKSSADYLSQIDNYYGNILKDSDKDFEEGVNKLASLT